MPHRRRTCASETPYFFAITLNGESEQKTPDGKDAKAPQSPCGMDMFWMLALMLVVFYFLLLRPQQKQEQKMKAMRSGLKRGDRVVTNGGMHGIVTAVDDDIVRIKPSADGPEMLFDAAAIGRVLSDEGTAGPAAK